MPRSALHRAPAVLLCAALLSAAPALAQGGPVPTPEEHFGFRVGADHKLADYAQIQGYFRALDAASERVALQEIGRSALGRPMLLAVISSEQNLRDRERFRAISRRLALAGGLDDQEARSLAREGRSIVWIDGGLHATEVAHGQMTSELAHWLATDESDEARRIRDNSIVLVMPVMNPDGLDIVVNWYRKNVGTPFEVAPVPELYHHYVGHDNNRDWFMFTQVETQAVARQLYHEWFPQIVYNHHQSSPFPGRIWGPPFRNPVNPNLDPLVVSSLNRIGEQMRARFDEEGKPGYNSGIVFDLWWNGSMRGAPDFHNMLGFLTETALYRYATPYCYKPEEIPDDFGERGGFLPAKEPSTSYTNPWLGGCWHLRDAVDYMLTASRAVADLGARDRETLLYNIYHMGKRQIARGQRAEGGPFAYVIDPAAQHDPGTAVELLRTLRIGGIDIRRADRPFAAGGRQYPEGSYVIPPQSFRPFVVDLIEPKRYPDRRVYPGGPPERPYDVTGYELSLQMGVQVDRVREPFDVPGTPLAEIPAAAGGVRGEGRYGFAAAPNLNAAALAANRLLKAGARISRAATGFEAAGRRWPAGTLIVRGAGTSEVDGIGRELGVEFHALSQAPQAALAPMRAPRIALYKSWVASMPEGWTRWLLEQYGFDYRNVTDAQIRRGDLRNFDVVVLPDQEAEELLRGHAPGEMPDAYTGGLGEAGAAALRRFVEQGGWLLAYDQAIDFAIEQLDLPVRNALADLKPQEFYIPCSLLRLEVETSSPLAAGMPAEAIASFGRSQAMEVTDASRAEVFARYASGDPLASGWALGAREHLAGKAAAVRVPLGRGQVVLLGFSPHFRGQPHNTYKLLFNPLFQSAVRPGGATDASR